MSISTTATKVSYAGNNSNSTPYAITFKYLDVSHVTVYADKVDITTNCTFSGDGASGTGQFTTDAAQAPTVTVAAVLDVPFDQPVVLQETGSLPAKTLEVSGFDRLNMQIRRVWRKAQNVLTFSSDEGSGSTGTADTLVGFDGSGDIAEIPNTTFCQTANNLSDVTAATARTNLNVDVAGTDNSTDVTTSGAGTYVTMGAGQVLTVDPITASDVTDFDTEVGNHPDVAANKSARHDAATKTGTGTYVSLTGQAINVDPIQDGDIDSEAATSDKILKSDGANGAAWGNVEGTEVASTGELTGSKFLRENGDGSCSWIDLSGLGTGDALVSSPLSQFASTTSAQLASVISDKTGTGALVFGTSPSLTTPDLGTPSAIDLTNATNTPIADGVGTTQGTDGVYDIQAKDEGIVAGNARGENSVDLQTSKTLATQVASGDLSALVGGKNNTAENLQSGVFCGASNEARANQAVVIGGSTNTTVSPRSFIGGGLNQDITSTGLSNAIIGGDQNTISGTGDRGVVLGGVSNAVSGTGSVSLGGTSNVSSGLYAYTAGRGATASHDGSKVFGDSTATTISSLANDEFAVQASALRLVDGGTALAGKVLTSDANGSGNWAALPVADTTTAGVVERATQAEVDAGTDTSRFVTPETLANYSGGGLSYATYSVVDGSRTSSGVLTLVEDEDPDGIGTVSAGVVTLGAGTYFITHSGEYSEDDNDTADYWDVLTRYNGATQASWEINETGTGDSYVSFSTSFWVTSVSSQTVDIYASKFSLAASLGFRNVQLTVIKLA